MPQKSTFWGYFEQKLDKFLSHFNKPPPQNPDFFIRRRRLIDADTVLRTKMQKRCTSNFKLFSPQKVPTKCFKICHLCTYLAQTLNFGGVTEQHKCKFFCTIFRFFPTFCPLALTHEGHILGWQDNLKVVRVHPWQAHFFQTLQGLMKSSKQSKTRRVICKKQTVFDENKNMICIIRQPFWPCLHLAFI